MSQLAYSRSIKKDASMMMISDGVDSESNPSFIEWGLSAATETCEPIYGFLPCSTNVWGLLFLIVVYEILLSLEGNMLQSVSALSGSLEAAQQRATLGMGLVAGTTVMLLTLIWGTSVVLGSYDLSEAITIDKSESKKNTPKGYGIVTDAETSYTARIMLITLAPFLILLLARVFSSSSGRRVIILIALIVTVILLFAYVFYQIFQPWIQNRRFEYLMNKYAKDKLLRLLLFNKIDNNKNASVSALELRVLLLGVKMDDDDLSTERDVENILESFDTSGDGRITQDEFIRGMTKLAYDLSDQTPDRIKYGGGNSNSQNQLQQGLLAKSSSARLKAISNSWLNYLRAFFFVIIGTVMLCALAEPLIKIQSIASARQKTQKSISLTLSAIYGDVYMNNIIGLIVFLAPVYARNLWADVFAEVLVVLIICILMTLLTSFRTTFARWMGYVVLLLYPISLALVYLFTSVM
ncbi:hypothetical protein DH2020_041854 [Rehmannia glutinosa]|uniref:EF-hand domain-containing protein n=1 Tax=Rehmannia glutinosa TaxID=99300 RepID=A0ABR0UQM8_REHGL